ncbi:MAG: urease accessory protein UreE [Acidobacteria bacterium]|nr:MAG: urease accessory protein UreE [Acidobacteriota bacterium]
MRRFTKLSTSSAENIPPLVLAFEARKKSRQLVRLDSGEEIGILLPPGTILRDGDVIESEDGSLFKVQAAREELVSVTATDPFQLLRAAYHLGNRHAAVQLQPDRILLPIDPVLKEMLVGLGLTVAIVSEQFTPETGAYGGGHKHGHDETFAEDYAAAQRVFHEHHGDK